MTKPIIETRKIGHQIWNVLKCGQIIIQFRGDDAATEAAEYAEGLLADLRWEAENN